MAVIVIWSTANGDAWIADNKDFGDKSNGDSTDAQLFYIRHDGVNPITSVGIYIAHFSGDYIGRSTASQDYNELLTWGDAEEADNYGGVEFNFNATATPIAFPSADWPTFSSKDTTYGFVARTGTGDDPSGAVVIPTSTGATASGTIQAGDTPNVRFQCRGTIPQSVLTTGMRMWEIRLKYTATS
jgi:hypothetical protein